MDVSLATLTVQNLIRTDLKSWCFDVLTTVFVAPDVSSIVRIRLHLHLSCEQRIKTGTRHGSCSVKSAYNLSVKYFTNSAELVGPVDCDLLYGALAYFFKKKKKLRQRGITCPAVYTSFQSEDETSLHVMFTCSIAKEVWMHLQL